MHHLSQVVHKDCYGSLAIRLWSVSHQIGGDLLPSPFR